MKEFLNILSDSIKEHFWIFRISMFILVILLFYIFRSKFGKLISKCVSIIAKRFNVNDIDGLLKKVEPPARLLFMIIGVWISLRFVSMSLFVTNFLNHSLRTLVVFTVFWFSFQISDYVIEFIETKIENSGKSIDDMMFSLFKNGLKTIIIVIGITVIVEEWGYNVGAIITGLGIGGLAVALAAKDTLANLFGSIMIMFDKPFSLGDWIMTPTVEGTVQEIGFRSTKIRTFAQALVSVPNSIVSNEPITNWTKMGKRRIHFKLGLTYDTSSEKIGETVKRIKTMLSLDEDVHKETIMVNFENFGDSALELFIYFFTNTTEWKEYMDIKEKINLNILSILNELNVSVAFPSTSVYIEKK
ncbi:MAG: mechanosensitive ion channel family protein [Clostridiales bacterium]